MYIAWSKERARALTALRHPLTLLTAGDVQLVGLTSDCEYARGILVRYAENLENSAAQGLADLPPRVSGSPQVFRSLVQAGLLNGKPNRFLTLKVHLADEKDSK